MPAVGSTVIIFHRTVRKYTLKMIFLSVNQLYLGIPPVLPNTVLHGPSFANLRIRTSGFAFPMLLSGI
jgi:hypothetical protein